MPSKRADIGPREIEEARTAAASRAYSSGDPLVFADGIERGLSLRVQGGAVSWVLKWNGRSKVLGRLGEIRTAKAAREVANRVRAILRDGLDPADYLKARLTGADHAVADAKVALAKARAMGRWTFADLARAYCDEYLSKPRMTSQGILKPPSLSTATEARRYLAAPEAAHLQDRLVSELSPGDLEDVRNACEKAGRKTASRQFVAYAKAALTYARRKQSRLAGLEGVRPWWLEVEKLDSTIPVARSRHPTVTELARVLWVAENTRVAPGREVNRETSEEVLAGLWWLALTAQRTGAGLSIQHAHILPWPDGPHGWKVAVWPLEAMKSKRAHVLPIPPRAVLLVDRARGADPESQSTYVFPAKRTRGARRDAPMTKTTPNLLLQRLRGRPSSTVGEEDMSEGDKAKQPLPNLLNEIPYFTPHDMRRTFATTCGDLAVRGDAVSAVLDHVNGNGVGGRFAPSATTAEITRLAYDYSQRLELKRVAIQAWTDALFEACDAEWDSHRPRGLRIPRLPGALLPWVPWYRVAEKEADRKAAAEEERIRLERENRGPMQPLAILRATASSEDDIHTSEEQTVQREFEASGHMNSRESGSKRSGEKNDAIDSRSK